MKSDGRTDWLPRRTIVVTRLCGVRYKNTAFESIATLFLALSPGDRLIEVRIHGRAGQGVVTAAELLATAAAKEGKYSKAFPFFGAEKRGPPVEAFCRIDDKPISFYEQVYNPDIVLVTDASILKSIPVARGLKKNGVVLVNSHEGKVMGLKAPKLFVIDGTAIAMKHIGRPITNTVMLGALVKATGAVKLESLKGALFERFKKEVAEKNYLAIKECYEALKV